MSSNNEQSTKILDYLKEGNSLTSLDALALFGSFRLAARIHDLRKAGHEIKTLSVPANGRMLAKYTLK